MATVLALLALSVHLTVTYGHCHVSSCHDDLGVIHAAWVHTRITQVRTMFARPVSTSGRSYLTIKCDLDDFEEMV